MKLNIDKEINIYSLATALGTAGLAVVNTGDGGDLKLISLDSENQLSGKIHPTIKRVGKSISMALADIAENKTESALSNLDDARYFLVSYDSNIKRLDRINTGENE